MESYYKENYELIKDIEQLPLGEYDTCNFTHCDLSGSNLSGYRFISCNFSHCDLSLIKTTKTAFQDCTFTDTKMLGLRLDNCDTFALSFNFTNCQLNHCSFFKLKLKKIRFKACQLHEVDFTECDLTESAIEHCDLYRATFENTNLEKASFRNSININLDPEMNKLKKAIFNTSQLAGLLNKYNIIIEPDM